MKQQAIDHYINGQLISIAAFMVQSQSAHDDTILHHSSQVFPAYQEALLILRDNLSNYRHNDCLRKVLDSKSYPYNVDDFVGSALNSVNASIRLLRYIPSGDEPVGDKTYKHFLSYHYNFKKLAL